MLAQFTLLPMVEVDALARGARRRPRPRGRPAGARAGGHRRSCTAPTAAAGGRAGQRRALRRRPPAGVARRAGRGRGRGARAPRWPPGESLADGVDLAPVLLRTRPGLLPGGRPAPARAAAAWPSTARRWIRAAGSARTTCSPAAGCCCARGRRGGRSWMPAHRVDTFPDPPIGCPSAPRRPRQRRARLRKGHPGTTAPRGCDCRSSAALRGGRRSLKTEERTKKRVRATARLSSEGRAAVQRMKCT